jgi:hypothetical protein
MVALGIYLIAMAYRKAGTSAAQVGGKRKQ